MQSVKLFKKFIFFAIILVSANFNAYGYDLFGSDIAGIAVQDANQCAVACNDNSNCLAWTFVRAGLKGSSASCFLKNPVPKPSWNDVCQTNFDCVSGYKEASWCGDKSQGDVLTCQTGTSCDSRRHTSCTGWWIFKSCTTLVTTNYYCQ